MITDLTVAFRDKYNQHYFHMVSLAIPASFSLFTTYLWSLKNVSYIYVSIVLEHDECFIMSPLN